MMKDNLDSWDNFCGANFLKAVDVANEQQGFVVAVIEDYKDEDSSAKPRLTVTNSGKEYTFDLNVTNSNFCKNNGIANPKMLLGKTLYFRKVNVMSPKAKKEVESLRISRIE